MSADNKDLLDLCRLNLMEERIGDVTETANASHGEVSNFKAGIKFAKQKVANRILGTQKPASEEVLARNQAFQSECEQLAKEGEPYAGCNDSEAGD